MSTDYGLDNFPEMEAPLPDATDELPRPSRAPGEKRAWHRIGAVRRQQGMSLRRIARHMNLDMRTLREQEEETSDLTLSQLFAWQRVLDVPISELLVEADDPLSPGIMDRARMVRLMKTVGALLERSIDAGSRRLVQNLVEQLTEMMPELKGVSPWHTVGQRRTLEDYGRIVERVVSEDIWRDR